MTLRGGDVDIDTRKRLERLCKAEDAELAVSLRTYGIHPSSYGLATKPPAPPDTVLDDLFASLSLPPRTQRPPLSPQRYSSVDIEALPEYPDLVRAILDHPPGVFDNFSTPTGPQTSPTPNPSTALPNLRMPQQQLNPQQPSAPAYEPSQPSQRRSAPAHQPSLSANPHPRTSHPRQSHPRVLPLSLPASRKTSLRAQRKDNEVIDLDGDVNMDTEIEFEAALAQESATRARREGRKRPDRPSHEGDGGPRGRGYNSRSQPQPQSPNHNRGACVISDDEDGEYERGNKRGRRSKADRELNQTLATNPYCAAFQQQRHDIESEDGDGNFGDFRSAASKYAADQRKKGKRPRAGNNSEKLHGKQGGFGSDRQNDGMDVARTVTKAVLGPRRARFSAPRQAGAGAKTPAGADSKAKEEASAMREALLGAVVTETPNVRWDDVAGLHAAKDALKEAVILPRKFPEMFTGKRRPWKGVLLYGPPGTGKSFLAKAVATEAESYFISLSSSDLVSKWQGESEKLVKELFVLAREMAPTVIFIDEIDSLVSSRNDTESESSRRIKTEFLVQMDGVGNGTDGVLVLGATNIPWGLDDALLRRMERRVYIPLPDLVGRARMFELNVGDTPHELTEKDFEDLARRSDGFSGSDLTILARDAIMQPVRIATTSYHFKKIEHDGVTKLTPCSRDDPAAENIKSGIMGLESDKLYLPPVNKSHFESALENCKPSVGQDTLEKFLEFTRNKGQEGR